MDERVRDLLDKVRSTAVTVGEVAGTTARYAGKCAGQMVDVAKLNMKIFDLKTEINNHLRDIGQSVYSTHLGAESDHAAVASLLAQLDAHHSAIDEVKERIHVLKNSRACPHCNAPCGRDDKFCKECGGAL